MEWFEIIASILVGVLTAIPLLVKCVSLVIKLVKEKNWRPLLTVAMELITQAETLYDNGADRKAWVMEMLKTTAKSMGLDIDVDSLSEMVDSIVEVSNKINTNKDKNA